MQLMEIKPGLTIVAGHISAIQVQTLSGRVVSDIHMKAGKVYTVDGDWAIVLRKLVKTGSVWTDGHKWEQRA
jgi:hypothetical protein